MYYEQESELIKYNISDKGEGIYTSVTCVLFTVIISVTDVHTVVIEFVLCNRYVNHCNTCSAYVIPYLVVQVAVHL